MSSSSSLVTASNRKRIVIIASFVLVCLIFISFRPREPSTWRPWASPGIQPGTVDSSAGGAKGPSNSDTTPSHAVPSAKLGTFYDAEKEAALAPTAAHPAASKSTVVAKPAPTHARITTDEVCKTHAKTDDVLIVMKTGATEAYDKLPIHFLTTLRCANDTILFSDMEMEMGGRHIIDALKDIKPDVKSDNRDFELYDKLQQYHELYEDPRGLKNGGNGWNLDKYKFNQIMLKTWQYRQDPKWYVFIEADTYLVWDNLRTLLDKYDPDKAYYIGSPTYLDIEFAHGGTGYVFSRGAMKKGIGGHLDFADKYDKEIHSYCCGDRFPAKVMLDEDIKLTKAWPMFNGEKPLTLPYGKNHWCQPLITMHHMTAQEVSQVWTYEQLRKDQGIEEPMMIKDVYDHFVKNNLGKLDPPTRDDWNNLSGDQKYKPVQDAPGGGGLNEGQDFQSLSDIKRQSVESPQNCERLCLSEADCYGWMHKDNECSLSKSIKIGGSMDPDNGKRFTSGWNKKRIMEFVNEMGDCPNGPDWTVRGI